MNIDNICVVIIDKIGELKHHISGCNEAFKVLANSIDMLKTNFNGYYKASINAGSTEFIVEEFVSDLITTNIDNKKVQMQLQKIIAFMKNRVNSSGKKMINELVGDITSFAS